MVTVITEPGRVNVLGVGVHAINMNRAVELVETAREKNRKGYVCVTGVHGVMEAQKDQRFRAILNHSLLTTPDGMPTVWVGKLQGAKRMGRVFGPDFMLRICESSVRRGATHFLFGGVPGVAEELKRSLEAKFPGIRIVGTYTPPFRPLNAQEEAELISQVAAVKPDYFWVGLSTPKQERFMAEYIHKLDVKIMFGVGAAFDVHTGRMKDSPEWVKNSGLQWAHRLIQDPKRLWKRYLVNNPKFLLAITKQLVGLRRHELSPMSS